jgi:hypothetical protein
MDPPRAAQFSEHGRYLTGQLVSPGRQVGPPQHRTATAESVERLLPKVFAVL